MRLKDAAKWIAMTTDGNGRYCYLDPYIGAMMAVSEASRNLVVSGAEPIGLTNCLNFGNPTKPEAYWQFHHSLRGMKEACLAFNVPVTGGNVSFYNENPKGSIYPTPIIGMVGVIEEEQYITKSFFKKAGDLIFLIGPMGSGLGGSEYLSVIHGLVQGPLPDFSLEKEIQVQNVIKNLIHRGLVESAHDCSEGGLMVALAESAFGSSVGVSCNLKMDVRLDDLMFNESASRIVVSISASKHDEFKQVVMGAGVECTILGEVTENEFCVTVDGRGVINQPTKQIEEAWKQAIAKEMEMSS